MENYIVFVLINFIIDYILCLTLKQIFKLSCHKTTLLILQILNIALSVFFAIFEMKFILFVILKMAIYMFICLLITDSFKIKDLFKIYFSAMALMFSYYGFCKFFTLFAKSIILQIFGKNIRSFYNLIIILGVICYIFALFALIHNLSRNKNIKNFLKKISFLAFGRHIEIMGLIDSGNVLYDTKTNLPVIIVNIQSLKKFLPQNTYKNITTNNYNELGVSHYLKAVSISNFEIDIPIIEIKKVKIFDSENAKEVKCVLGVVNHKFENANLYDCLIHRDLI